MIVTLELPDDIARSIAIPEELSRKVMEALAVEGYRHQTLTQLQVGKLLGLGRIQTEDFLAQHTDLFNYEPRELQREADALEKYSKRLTSA